MKNKIILLILIISIVFIIYLTSFGLNIGNIKIASISDIIAENDSVNQKIDKVKVLTNNNYPSQVSRLQDTIEEYKIQRQKYEEISEFDSNEENIYETEKYDIGYLWTTLGKLASKNKIDLALNVVKTVGESLYDLEFTIQGEYVDISSFITKLENHSDLSFRIYNFKITPGRNSIDLKADFTVQDINLDEETLTSKSTQLVNSKVEEENVK